MNKKISLGIVLGVIVAITIVAISQMQVVSDVNDTIIEETKKPETIENETIVPSDNPGFRERDWVMSGPFQIDRSKYLLGENIFFRVTGLAPNEEGQIVFLRPKNETHYIVYQSFPFDGSLKTDFNTYFTPGLAALIDICSKDDLIGNWKIVFRGVPYENISFEIINKTLPGEEDAMVTVC